MIDVIIPTMWCVKDFPSYIVIDWDATAYNIEQDYGSSDIMNRTEFLARW
jgi:hypothetical protein